MSYDNRRAIERERDSKTLDRGDQHTQGTRLPNSKTMSVTKIYPEEVVRKQKAIRMKSTDNLTATVIAAAVIFT